MNTSLRLRRRSLRESAWHEAEVVLKRYPSLGHEAQKKRKARGTMEWTQEPETRGIGVRRPSSR